MQKKPEPVEPLPIMEAVVRLRKPGKERAQTSCSMQVTRASDYAVRVMIHLAAQPENERSTLGLLSRATAVPESFLSKVLQSLGRAGLVSSRRGQSGGFKILDAGRQASMAAVIEVIDGRFRLNRCMAPGASCERKANCPAHRVWVETEVAMLGVLRSHRIVDLAARGRPAHAAFITLNEAQGCV